MARVKSKHPKVNAFYRLPEPIVRRIRRIAADRNVDPCMVAEELITKGLKRDRTEENEAATAAQGA